jgi:dTDP-4-dehydrorhamnose reductase|tara:strand:- start:2965 stop:3660 length:696 start_codon:yes stop_codon:yes gene_type:complete
MENKILLLGGSGKLGKHLSIELTKQNIDFISPSHDQCDIENIKTLDNVIKTEYPNIIIHSAGLINTETCEINKQQCLDINVIGTYNIIKCCRKYNIRLVFISSEYVFSGEENEYTNHSPINPKNTYGLSKGCGELMTKTLDNHLIIRSPFIRSNTFPYQNAFSDQYTSRQYVNQITKDIVRYSITNENGIRHIVGKYQSVYDLAKQTNKNVLPIDTPDKLKNILPMKLNLI